MVLDESVYNSALLSTEAHTQMSCHIGLQCLYLSLSRCCSGAFDASHTGMRLKGIANTKSHLCKSNSDQA